MSGEALLIVVVVYVAPIVSIWWLYSRARARRERLASETLLVTRQAGLSEPASLHPLIDADRCIGCGACVAACPEGKILGLINAKAALIDPSQCIGHGACAAACPLSAIDLVFGSATRGVDIPHVSANFETNIPGIFIAGELGGMGLVRNAIEQGRQAVEAISRLDGHAQPGRHDLIIVGAGPAGLSAALAAKEKGLDYVVLEQSCLGGTVAHFPRSKLVMTAPAKLALVGQVRFREISKEDLLNFWSDVCTRHELNIVYDQRVDAIERDQVGFTVRSSSDRFQTRSVLLAIGRRGTPRKLGVPGEDLAKVVYRLDDPAQYRDRHVLVVGGGDSALEAAAAIAGEPGATVTLSYRSNAFSRAKLKNRDRIEAAAASGQVKVMLNSQVKRIGGDWVEIEWEGALTRIRNEAVVVCIGGILPTGFLKSIGIEIETKYGTR